MRKRNKVLISIIIPVYNEERYIERCIQSLQKQTINNYEIIVVNDGSTDTTSTRLSKYDIDIIDISHGGPGRAKNIGAREAKGKIFVFLDADMYYEENYLKNITLPIINHIGIATFTIAEYVANKENVWAQCWNIIHDLPIASRVKKNSIEYAFRAIRGFDFQRTPGFDPVKGYMDDKSLKRYDIVPIPVENAICYHFNPDTLKDVFYSARWIGRSISNKNILSIVAKYSIFNSIKIAVIKIRQGYSLLVLPFKILFDFGILTGIIFRNKKNNYAK